MTTYTGHMARSIPASEFKTKCLAILDEVADTRESLIVTKRGKAVARVEPIDPPRDLTGSFEQLCSDDELVHFSAWDEWPAEDEDDV
jgi:prevent-host-death family protein